MTKEEIKEIYIMYVNSKYDKGTAKMMLMSESKFNEFYSKYKEDQKFVNEVAIKTRKYKIKKLKEKIDSDI